MSSSPASARSRADALPECEPPRTTLGAPITVAMPASREAAAASWVVGNSAMRTPSRLGECDVVERGVVVAGEGQAMGVGELDDLRPIARRARGRRAGAATTSASSCSDCPDLPS